MNKSESFSWLLWLSTGLYVAVSAFLFTLINSVQPEPYMDEIFHIPQARKYCNGKFTEVCLKFSWQNSSKLKCNCRCVANPTNTVLLLTTFLQSKLFQTTFSGDLNTEHLNNGIYENI